MSTRVLVIYKKSQYQLLVQESDDPRIKNLIKNADPSVQQLVEAHARHEETVARAKALLRTLTDEAVYRPLNEPGSSKGFDLVVTLGGDGTLLWASHVVGPGLPMLAINTSPESSVGYLCGGSADTLDEVLPLAVTSLNTAAGAAALKGQGPGEIDASELTRMEVLVDSEVISRRVLNDALFTAACPAATTRYLVYGPNGEAEEHRSSGIWIGPAAGSTAAQRSAGGKVLPIDSTDLQFVVREPYAPPGVTYSTTGGMIDRRNEFRVRSKTPEGRLYLDGPHREHVVHFGMQVIMRRSEEPLTLLGLSRRQTR